MTRDEVIEDGKKEFGSAVIGGYVIGTRYDLTLFLDRALLSGGFEKLSLDEKKDIWYVEPELMPSQRTVDRRKILRDSTIEYNKIKSEKPETNQQVLIKMVNANLKKVGEEPLREYEKVWINAR